MKLAIETKTKIQVMQKTTRELIFMITHILYNHTAG